MPHETPKQKSGHRFSNEPVAEDKGTEFVDPLAGPGNSSGYRHIDTAKPPRGEDTSDLRGGDRRGAVLDNLGEVTESSANRVKRTER